MTHVHGISEKKLGIAIVLNAFIFLIELFGGILTNSLGLISDSIHNLSDFVALILSYFANRVISWDSNHRKTYGYVRVEAFVALINSMMLVWIGIYLLYKAIQRIGDPEPVLGLPMLIVAIVGFIANALAALLLRKDSSHDLNAKSAYLHLLTDAVESLAVVMVGSLICWKGWTILDPIVSAVIGIFIIKSAWNIVAETVNILTEGTPKGIDIDALIAAITSVPGVASVHHIHVWSLSSRHKAMSAHVVVDDTLISESATLVAEIEAKLEKMFALNHPTLQLETEVCREQTVIVNINRVAD
jgi:cobalt-zinc-cadmium efflux system protein